MRSPKRLASLVLVVLVWSGAATLVNAGPADEATGGMRTRAIPQHPALLEFSPRVVRIPAAAAYLHRLEGGLPVVVVEDHTLPLVEVVIALPRPRSGSVGSVAMADLAAAMMRRGGTMSRPAADFDDAVDYLGAAIDSRATAERSVARLSALAASLDEALELFFEMLREPAYESGRVTRARENLLSSLRGRNDDPIEVMERELGWLLFGPDAPRAAQSTARDLEGLEAEDLQRYHQRAWRPETGVVAVSGAVDTDAVLERLEAGISRWQASMGESPEAPAEPANGGEGELPASERHQGVGAGHPGDTPEQAAPGLYWTEHASSQSKVSVALLLEPLGEWDARRAAALDLANEVLGGTGMLSRLGGRLRGREGLVYRVLSEVELHLDEPGLWRIFLDTDGTNLGRALTGIVEEIERLRREPVGKGELDAVREEVLSRTAHRFDSAEEIAGYFAEDLLVERDHAYWSEYVRRLQELTAEDIRRTASELLDPGKLVVVVVGGPNRIEDLESLPSSHRRVRAWLRGAVELPRRDPLTLEPLPDGPAAPISR